MKITTLLNSMTKQGSTYVPSADRILLLGEERISAITITMGGEVVIDLYSKMDKVYANLATDFKVNLYQKINLTN